jgi:hypothetical protein
LGFFAVFEKAVVIEDDGVKQTYEKYFVIHKI